MKLTKLFLFTFLYSILSFLILTQTVYAQIQDDTTSVKSGGSTAVKSFPNPLGSTKDVPTIIGGVIGSVLGIVGSLALVMFIYGGFLWMLSAGNNEKIEKGKKTLLWATIGLVVIFSSYAIVKLVFGTIGIK